MRVFDLFCGGGGSSLGARMAGASIVGGAEIDPYACATFKVNFPQARMFQGDLRTLEPSQVAQELGAIDLLLSSPECTNHTCAKGNAPRSEESKETAMQVIRFAAGLSPKWIVLENVIHMKPWSRYPTLKAELEGNGYTLREEVLDAADFGVPQHRRRLFLIGSKDGTIPPMRSRQRSHKPAWSILDTDRLWKTNPLYSPKRAEATLERAERAMKEVGRSSSFLLVYYGSDGGGGWQSLDQPLRTVTTLDRFALVRPSSKGHTMRMLQANELRRAMGFPSKFRFAEGPRRSQIRILGNAVCPPVMASVVRQLQR